jgi:hypothetical protein
MCLALFTLAIAAGNRGFLAIGDWITSYREQLIDLLKPPKNRLPSYSTVRRALLHIDYEQYSARLAKFFDVQPHQSGRGKGERKKGVHVKKSFATRTPYTGLKPLP